ncbi:hypothetical protein NP493_610g01002 [Ridgeia piscesae]|uniref:Uncharacterized protein n=1 Tax=Ridgeia piscesae TaxID=27915 RepID=A0AAD9KTL5_RIDPI|nr:hypothetical protein NP493_610g01002 [Ridgeia piscesae]
MLVSFRSYFCVGLRGSQYHHIIVKGRNETKLSKRNNIALHLVGESGTFFPVNFLRNVALDHAKTKYIFLSDVDFEPMPRLEGHLKRYISEGYLQGKTVGD